jgi:hypothetical protein
MVLVGSGVLEQALRIATIDNNPQKTDSLCLNLISLASYGFLYNNEVMLNTNH